MGTCTIRNGSFGNANDDKLPFPLIDAGVSNAP